MVYESDFYTTRRPYRPATYSTPFTSSYYTLPSVPLSLAQAELIWRAPRTVTRLMTSPEAPYHALRVRTRPAVVLRELDRIQHRRRPLTAHTALDDYYNYESTKTFEDERRRIRADTASLLQRARSVVPRATSVAPLDTIYSYYRGEPLTSHRFSNDDYISRLVLPLRAMNQHIRTISFFPEPAKRFTGRGQLACVHYSGKKAFSNRRPLYKELSVRDDVNLLSFYAKNRLAAAGLASDAATAAAPTA